jgi:hypothetical protein
MLSPKVKGSAILRQSLLIKLSICITTEVLLVLFPWTGNNPLGFFVPRKMIDTSQLLGFLDAWFSFEIVIS